MTGNIHDNIRGSVWFKRLAMGAVGIGMLGIAACGSSGGGVYYSDGPYYGSGSTGVYYHDTYRPTYRTHRHYRTYDRGYYSRGYYDRHGHWRRY